MIESGAVVDSHWVLLGSLKDLMFGASSIWPGADKEVKVTVRLTDMSMFNFGADTNLSHWLDRDKLEVTFSHTTPAMGEDAVISNTISFQQARNHGVGEFALRCLITPKSHLGASVWVAATPYTKEQLRQSLGGNSNTHLTPHITLPVTAQSPHPGPSTGRSVYAAFSRLEKRTEGFGFGVIPWIDITAEGVEDATLPDSEALKESLLRFMRNSTTAATATTAAAMGQRMQAVVGGGGIPAKNPPHVFLEFQPSEVEEPQTQGQC